MACAIRRAAVLSACARYARHFFTSFASHIMQHQTQSYPAIDLAKFLFAFVIVGIHTTVFCQFKWLDMGFDVFSRVAVPFFFAASGFFFFNKPVSGPNCARFAKRLLILYLIYSAIFVLIRSILKSEFDSEGIFLTMVSGIRHLWFLHALLFGTMIAAILVRFIKKPWIVYLITALCLVFRWCTATMWPLFAHIDFLAPLHGSQQEAAFIGLWNALCFALPMVLVGHRLSQSEPKFSMFGNLIAVFLSFMLLGAETYISSAILHTDSRTIYLSCVPLAFFAMRLCQQIQHPKDLAVSLFMRKTSTLIYCIHPAFILTPGAYIAPGIARFAVVSLCALAFGILVYWGSKQRHGGWLRYFQ